MSALSCCGTDELPERLNHELRCGRALVSLGASVLAARRCGPVGTFGAAGAGRFGVSHLVAACTGYARGAPSWEPSPVSSPVVTYRSAACRGGSPTAD